jgi:multidrug efflux pump subunit AcrA (membrane-fusion protein)
MKKRMALMLLVLALVFGGIFAWKAFVGHMMRQMLAHRAVPPTVSVATARLTEWAPQLHSVASLSAVRVASDVGRARRRSPGPRSYRSPLRSRRRRCRHGRSRLPSRSR